jgi:hypothetical protein
MAVDDKDVQREGSHALDELIMQKAQKSGRNFQAVSASVVASIANNLRACIDAQEDYGVLVGAATEG